MMRFPRHRAAASLKLTTHLGDAGRDCAFSAASGRGLIEATRMLTRPRRTGEFSAASGRGLIEASHLVSFPVSIRSFPRHRAAASLKRPDRSILICSGSEFSAASGRGLIEAFCPGRLLGRGASFPRHRAAASLKLTLRYRVGSARWSFPRHRAAASLKHRGIIDADERDVSVFRGIGPRPH